MLHQQKIFANISEKYAVSILRNFMAYIPCGYYNDARQWTRIIPFILDIRLCSNMLQHTYQLPSTQQIYYVIYLKQLCASTTSSNTQAVKIKKKLQLQLQHWCGRSDWDLSHRQLKYVATHLHNIANKLVVLMVLIIISQNNPVHLTGPSIVSYIPRTLNLHPYNCQNFNFTSLKMF